MNENPTRYWVRSFTSTVPAWISPEVTPELGMRPEYDFRGGERGKYYARYYRRSRWQAILEYLRVLYR